MTDSTDQEDTSVPSENAERSAPASRRESGNRGGFGGGGRGGGGRGGGRGRGRGGGPRRRRSNQQCTSRRRVPPRLARRSAGL